MRRCRGKSSTNNRCRKTAREDSNYCQIHRKQATAKNKIFPGAIGGALIGARIAHIPGAFIGLVGGAIIGKSLEMEIMDKSKVFISFDYDNDSDLKILLMGQSKYEGTPFEISDWSVKEHIDGDWKAKVRTKLKRVDQVAVICGEKTHTAIGVSAEITLAQEEGVPYFLLKGRSSKTCTKPISAKSTDKIYNWTWENLKNLIGGVR